MKCILNIYILYIVCILYSIFMFDNINVYICIMVQYTHARTHTRTHTNTHIYIYIYIFIYMHICIYRIRYNSIILNKNEHL